MEKVPFIAAAFYAALSTVFRVFRVFRGYFSIDNGQLAMEKVPFIAAAFYAALSTVFRVFRVFRGSNIVNCQLSIVNS